MYIETKIAGMTPEQMEVVKEFLETTDYEWHTEGNTSILLHGTIDQDLIDVVEDVIS